MVHGNVVARQADDLAIALRELRQQLGKGGQLRGTDGGEVGRVRAEHSPGRAEIVMQVKRTNRGLRLRGQKSEVNEKTKIHSKIRTSKSGKMSPREMPVVFVVKGKSAKQKTGVATPQE